MKIDPIFIIIPFCIIYVLFIILFCIFIINSEKYNYDIFIVDNLNFSYIECISDLILSQEELEKKINFFDKSTDIKLSLGIFNKDIFCECFNNKSEKITLNDIKLCYFF